MSLLDIAIVLAKHKKIVLGVPLLAGVLALLVALLLPKVYTATARILPPQQKESSAIAMLGVLTGAAGSIGATAGQALGIRNPNDLYAAILRGHTIADRLIERFKLRELYGIETMVNARKSLENVTRITPGKDGLITIEVDDKDPQRAAELANAHVEELDRLMQGLAVTEASQRRLFFEKQVANARDQLIAAEAALRHTIDTKGITVVDAQSRGVVGTAEQLRAQIAVREIQLDAMNTFATERNPDFVRLRREIESMKAELARLEGGRSDAKSSQSPAGMESIRRLREVKFLEFTTELLTKQYEIAKIDEAKDAVIIQIVDRAVPPDYKSKPKRALIVVMSTLLAGISCLVWVLWFESHRRSLSVPGYAERVGRLRENLRFRSSRNAP